MKLKPFETANESGAKAAAVQTLRECQATLNCAERLDCGAFTAAFSTPKLINRK